MQIKKNFIQDEVLYELIEPTHVRYIKDITKLSDYQGIIPKCDFYTWDNLHKRVVKENTNFYPIMWVGDERKRCSPYLIIYKQSNNLNDWETLISDIRIDFYYNLGDEERWGEGIRSICINGKWGAVQGNTGKVIVPFGEYDFIDGFCFGLSRVKKKGVYYIDEAYRHENRKEKWGIINTKDEIVLPVEYDAVYSFYNKQFKNVFIIKDGVRKEFPLWMSENEHFSPYNNDYDDVWNRELDYLREKITGYKKSEFNNRYGKLEKNYMNVFIGCDDTDEEDCQ